MYELGDKDTSLPTLIITKTLLLTVNVLQVFPGQTQPQTATHCKEIPVSDYFTLHTEVGKLKCQPQDPVHPRG